MCPDETAACLAHPACAPHIGAPQPPDKPPPGFLELILCFQRSGVGMARRSLDPPGAERGRNAGSLTRRAAQLHCYG